MPHRAPDPPAVLLPLHRPAADLDQPVGTHVHRLVEVDPLPVAGMEPAVEHPVLPGGAGGELEAGRAFGAEAASAHGRVEVAFDLDDLVVFHVDVLPAADAQYGQTDFAIRLAVAMRGWRSFVVLEAAAGPRPSLSPLRSWRMTDQSATPTPDPSRVHRRRPTHLPHRQPLADHAQSPPRPRSPPRCRQGGGAAITWALGARPLNLPPGVAGPSGRTPRWASSGSGGPGGWTWRRRR